MKTYELVENERWSCIKMIEGDITMFIPLDPANSDYQAYLKWVEENNG